LGEDVLDSIGQRVESEWWNAEKALRDNQQFLAKDAEFHLLPQEGRREVRRRRHQHD
jgi:hypothetical protein